MAVRSEHVEQALEEVRVSGFDPKRRSTKWDLLDPLTGARWPPKVVLSRACEIADDHTRRGGGWPTNDVLEELGFRIVPKETLRFEDAEADLLLLPTDDLRKIATRHSSRPARRLERMVSTVERSPAISAYVKTLANGHYDSCAASAPFFTKNGPYLECHHIIWLSAGGLDQLANVVALCPNCHRKMHHATDDMELARLAALALTRTQNA